MIKLPLPSLKEFNRVRQTPAGVACDKCGVEMVRGLASGVGPDPFEQPVVCPECGYRGVKRPHGGG